MMNVTHQIRWFELELVLIMKLHSNWLLTSLIRCV